MTYKDTRPYARAIEKAVVGRTMPPWFADPTVGHFKNTKLLSDAEIEMISAWAEERRARRRSERQAGARAVRRRVDDRKARHHRGVPEGNSAAGNRRHRPVESRRARALREGHVGESRRSEAGQRARRPSHEGDHPAAEFDVARERARRRVVRPAARRRRRQDNAAAVGERPAPGAGHSREVQPGCRRAGLHRRQRREIHRGRLGYRVRDSLHDDGEARSRSIDGGHRAGGRPAAGSPSHRDGHEQRQHRYRAWRSQSTKLQGEATLASDAKLVWVQPHQHYRGRYFEMHVIYPNGETQDRSARAELPVRLAGGIRARRAARSAEGHAPRDASAATTTRPRTSSIPIRRRA